MLDGTRKLSNDPKPRGAIKLIGEENTYRIRIGDYRVLYEVYYDQKIVLIVKIDKRSRVYD
jgi:mRNA interferase RelE/StbE